MSVSPRCLQLLASLHKHAKFHRRKLGILASIDTSVDGLILFLLNHDLERASISFLGLDMADGGTTLLESEAHFRRFATVHIFNRLKVGWAAAPLANSMLRDEGAHLLTV
jgi:hypothetical protein